MGKCENIKAMRLEELAEFAAANSVALTIPGAEDLLAAGIADVFRQKKLKIFGPHQAAAKLESSKSFAKEFMKKHGIRTAEYEVFTSADEAYAYLKTAPVPLVVKADGLAAGKGVLICQTREEAVEAIGKIMVDRCFGNAGRKVVIEEFLWGTEASILSIFNGNNIVPFISAKDHKKIGEGETGLNTGGMGVIAPNPYVTEGALKDFRKNILNPTLQGLKDDHLLFTGTIFFGLMLTARGVYLLEYNLRLGDPEAQAVLPLMQSDLLDVMELALEGKLAEENIHWSGNCSCAVVMASGGYPQRYNTGYEISGIDADTPVYVSGAEQLGNKLITAGGRVLTAVGIAPTAEEAREVAYRRVNGIYFTDRYFRGDIGGVIS